MRLADPPRSECTSRVPWRRRFAHSTGKRPRGSLSKKKMMEALQARSPLAILERGYALVFDASGKLLRTRAKPARS